MTDASALAGLDIDWSGLDGYQPLEAVLVMEALDEEGDLVLLHVASNGLRTWKAIGMAVYVADTLRHRMQED